MRIFLYTLVSLVLTACGGSRLSDAERLKLDPLLQRLVSDVRVVEDDYSISTRPDGVKEYGVIIYTDKLEELRSAGIPINSVVRDFATARLTVEELRKVVKLPSVRAVRNSGKDGLW